MLTEPLDALYRPGRSKRPRLAEVSEALGCDAFVYAGWDGDSETLLEATAAGAFRASGPNAQSEDPSDLYGMRIGTENRRVSFGLLKVPAELRDAMAAGSLDAEQALLEHFGLDGSALSSPKRYGKAL